MATGNNARHFWPGRVFAHTYAEAQQKAEEFVRSKGAEPVGEIRPFPCLSQHREEIWWEFMALCHIEEEG